MIVLPTISGSEYEIGRSLEFDNGRVDFGRLWSLPLLNMFVGSVRMKLSRILEDLWSNRRMRSWTVLKKWSGLYFNADLRTG